MPSYKYIAVDDPLWSGTIANGINDAGQIVGAYNDGQDTQGFDFSNGSFTAVDDAGVFLGQNTLTHATQYPYVVDGEVIDLCGKIIRDADMGQTFSVAWIQQVLIGLQASGGSHCVTFWTCSQNFGRPSLPNGVGACFRAKKSRFSGAQSHIRFEQSKGMLLWKSKPPTRRPDDLSRGTVRRCDGGKRHSGYRPRN
jgi:probable HAF family extracellular repeat protein